MPGERVQQPAGRGPGDPSHRDGHESRTSGGEHRLEQRGPGQPAGAEEQPRGRLLAGDGRGSSALHRHHDLDAVALAPAAWPAQPVPRDDGPVEGDGHTTGITSAAGRPTVGHRRRRPSAGAPLRLIHTCWSRASWVDGWFDVPGLEVVGDETRGEWREEYAVPVVARRPAPRRPPRSGRSGAGGPRWPGGPGRSPRPARPAPARAAARGPRRAAGTPRRPSAPERESCSSEVAPMTTSARPSRAPAGRRTPVRPAPSRGPCAGAGRRCGRGRSRRAPAATRCANGAGSRAPVATTVASRTGRG